MGGKTDSIVNTEQAKLEVNCCPKKYWVFNYPRGSLLGAPCTRGAFKALNAAREDRAVPAAGLVPLCSGDGVTETAVLKLDAAFYSRTKPTRVGTAAIDKFRIHDYNGRTGGNAHRFKQISIKNLNQIRNKTY
ncbi:hypothetical protein K438DRAFT_1779454 [Mycena galopus ATCC 62051]|nr:hypothetical protein K438DRAFT_1779454 [Mycena galopus ATCC 62051]